MVPSACAFFAAFRSGCATDVDRGIPAPRCRGGQDSLDAEGTLASREPTGRPISGVVSTA